MRILFLSRWFPYPPDNGAKLRVYNALGQLARRHEVSLVALGTGDELANNEARSKLAELCCSVTAVPYRAFRPTSLRALSGLLSTQPRFLVDTFDQATARAIRAQLVRDRCELVVASQIDMVPYALTLRPAPAVLEELEVSAYREAVLGANGLRTRLRRRLTWLKLSAYLRTVLPRFSVCTVVSEQEKRLVEGLVPDYGRIAVVPNAVDLARYEEDYGPPVGGTLIYPGALTYQPNFDAVRYFLSEVYPLVLRSAPTTRLQVTGSLDGVQVDRLPRVGGVTFAGHVPDVRPFVARSWAMVVPLRRGGGTRLKILEAMALRTPVVATSKGAEGLEVEDGKNILIADDPATFAARVLELLGSPALRARIGSEGRRLVEAKHDWERVGESLVSIVEQAGRLAALGRAGLAGDAVRGATSGRSGAVE